MTVSTILGQEEQVKHTHNMTWKIVITDKSQLCSDGTVTLAFKLYLDDEEKGVFQVIDQPDVVSTSAQRRAEEFIALYEAYTTEGVVPEVGEEIILSL